MKILHIGKYWPMKGGMETVINDITRHFSGKGHQCDMLCVATKEPGIYTINENCKIISVPAYCNVAKTALSSQMITTLRKIANNYDVIHIHCPNPIGNVALLLANFKGKVIVHWHSDIIKQKHLLRLYEPLQNLMLKKANIIIGTSDAYLEGSPCLRNVIEKTHSCPIGVTQVEPKENDVQCIKSRYNNRKIILSVGRLTEYKGHKYLIEAAKYLNDEYIILIAGIGSLQTQLEKQIISEKLQNKVILLGKLSDAELHNHYGACDVFCLSSIWKSEAFGVVQIEAMSCGKPVVATNIEGSGVPWVNKHGYSGLNVPPMDSVAIANAIKEITIDESLYRGYSQNALLRYQKLFTKEKMLARCEEIYNVL